MSSPGIVRFGFVGEPLEVFHHSHNSIILRTVQTSDEKRLDWKDADIRVFPIIT